MTNPASDGQDAARRATLSEVAERAGVSLATASRALAGTYPVAEKTKARVVEAATDLGYARGRRAGDAERRFPTVAVVAHDIRQEFLVEIVSGIEQVAAGAGHFCLVGSTGYSAETELAMLDNLVGDPAIEGVVVAGGAYDTPAYRAGMAAMARRFADRGLPLVFCGRPGLDDDSPITVVDYDRAGGAASAVGHLLSRGHRRIAFLRGPRGFSTSEGRAAGHDAALASFGVPVDERLVKTGERSRATGYQRTRELLAEEAGMTAIFAENDYMAAGCLAALREAGLSVPGDVSVIGYDDLDVSQETWPPLTTVHLPFDELGRAAARLVLAPAEPGSGRETAVFGTHLVIRESVRSLW
ncbi:LacI family DNA-binding transcriptional regulator [Streptomyces sp. NPDC060194]|uniref:LacI family DNA-binding transcriptional regulator n=1 Tax=Streptomyces sp. NPDC060194 TaxID=3347069 RepID=UPI003649246A